MRKFADLGAELWAISPDPLDRLAKWAEQNAQGLTLLSDRDLEVIRAYGVLNEEKRSIPHPTSLIVGRAGNVRWIRIDRDYTKRPPVEELLTQLRLVTGAD